jgi:hypothetical protein
MNKPIVTMTRQTASREDDVAALILGFRRMSLRSGDSRFRNGCVNHQFSLLRPRKWLIAGIPPRYEQPKDPSMGEALTFRSMYGSGS